MTSDAPHKSLTIEEALHGGFVVIDRSSITCMAQLLFAGKLGECLSFIGRQFPPRQATDASLEPGKVVIMDSKA